MIIIEKVNKGKLRVRTRVNRDICTIVPSSHPQTLVCSREGCQSSAVTGLSKRIWYRSWPVETFQMIKEWSSEPDARNSPEEENSRQLTLSEWVWESVCFRMYAYDMRGNGWTQTNKLVLYFNFLLRWHALRRLSDCENSVIMRVMRFFLCAAWIGIIAWIGTWHNRPT